VRQAVQDDGGADPLVRTLVRGRPPVAHPALGSRHSLAPEKSRPGGRLRTRGVRPTKAPAAASLLCAPMEPGRRRLECRWAPLHAKPLEVWVVAWNESRFWRADEGSII
jgi:hypothetical protein